MSNYKYFIGEWYSDNIIMTDYLDELVFYSGTERKKMLKTSGDAGSMLYGLTWRSYLSPDKNRTPSKYKGLCQTKCMDLYPFLDDIFQEFKSIYFPNFEYLQVQLNKNFKAPPHKDSKNVGESVLCCFGDYQGGTTMVNYGDKIVEYDAQLNPVKFNGSKYEHWVKDYTGTRYSLVFFNNIKRKLELR